MSIIAKIAKMAFICMLAVAEIIALLVHSFITDIAMVVFLLAKLVQVQEKTVKVVSQLRYTLMENVSRIVLMELTLEMEAAYFVTHVA